MNRPKTKKQPYTGDPNARLTMCPKKLRRHATGDFDYVFQRVRAQPEDQQSNDGEGKADRIAVGLLCRHCRQNPVKEANDQS